MDNGYNSAQDTAAAAYEYTSLRNLNGPKAEGFWGALSRKAKSIIDDDNPAQQPRNPTQNLPQTLDTPPTGTQVGAKSYDLCCLEGETVDHPIDIPKKIYFFLVHAAKK